MLEPSSAKLAGSGTEPTTIFTVGGPSKEKKSVEPGAIGTLKFTIPEVNAPLSR